MHFDEKTLMPNSVECFLHVEECHIGFSPLVAKGLDGLLQNEGRVDTAKVPPLQWVEGRGEVCCEILSKRSFSDIL